MDADQYMGVVRQEGPFRFAPYRGLSFSGHGTTGILGLVADYLFVLYNSCIIRRTACCQESAQWSQDPTRRVGPWHQTPGGTLSIMPVSAEDALRRLREGNSRFRNGSSEDSQRSGGRAGFADLSAGQEPFAAVLGCSDSRVPVEMVFDQGPGQIFVVRVAGNVVGPTGIGSLEFAVQELGVRLLLVLGHTGCGAVAATLAPKPATEMGVALHNLGEITDRIWRSLGTWRQRKPTDPEPPPGEAEHIHARAVVAELLQQSELLALAVRAGRLVMVAAIYDLKTGQAEFLDLAGPPTA